jgi:hypothetical protein
VDEALRCPDHSSKNLVVGVFTGYLTYSWDEVGGEHTALLAVVASAAVALGRA